MNIKTKIRDILRKLGYEISKVGSVDILESLIYKNYRPDYFFIQIGANDGKRFDPIFGIVNKLHLRGLVLEPVKEYFDELVENYKNTKVVPINKAIYTDNKKITIYRVINNSSLPEWIKGIASIDPDHYKKSNIDKLDIVEEIVDGITFDALLSEYHVINLDLLQIDTEGYDKEIIKSIPFEKIKPRIIHFEHGFADNVMSINDFLQINKILLENNYKLIMKDYDCIAYL